MIQKNLRVIIMALAGILVSIFFVLVGHLIFKIVVPPLNFPRNIPTIPFYVIFLPTIFNIDQTKLYDMYLREPLEKHGAAKIFFGSRWNIIVTRPELMAHVFREEDTFAKSGNQKKIPYAVIAAYTGDNVISAHGQVWRTYRSVVTNGLQHFDDKPFYKNAELFCNGIEKLRRKTPESASMGPLIQRLCLDNISEVALGFDFGALTQDDNQLHKHLIDIKKQIFHPMYLTFPFLDLLPIPARRKAFKDVASFREQLVTKIQDNLVTNYKFEQTSFASSDLIRAHNNEIINYQQLTDNIIIILVAGHENPQVLLTTSLYLLGKHPALQQKIRAEVQDVNDSKELSELPFLNSFIFEAIRLFPPLNIIINRKTTKACRLGPEIVIPKDTYVGYNNFGTSHDPKVWGPNADQFDPTRWGEDNETILKNWKHAKNAYTMTAFHGGRRACLGEKLALTEMRVTIAEVLRQYKWTLASDWEERMTPAGPLSPSNLKLNFESCSDAI